MNSHRILPMQWSFTSWRNEIDVMTDCNIWIFRMDRTILLIDCIRNRKAQIKELLSVFALEFQTDSFNWHDRVEVSSICNVVGEFTKSRNVHLLIEGKAEGWNIGHGDRLGSTILNSDINNHQSSRCIKANRCYGLDNVDQLLFNQSGCHSNSSMSTHRQTSRYFDIDDSPIGIWSRWFLQNCTAHSAMASRFKHQPLAPKIHMLHKVQALIKHRRTRNFTDTRSNYTCRHSLGMCFNRCDRTYALHGLQPTLD